MKPFLTFLVILFCITLAIIIGNRMSTEAMAVVVGVVCGVVASIPMSLILVLATGKLQAGRASPATGSPGYGAASYPPVVIVSPGGDNRLMAMPFMPGNFPPPAPHREFTIIGEEAE